MSPPAEWTSLGRPTSHFPFVSFVRLNAESLEFPMPPLPVTRPNSQNQKADMFAHITGLDTAVMEEARLDRYWLLTLFHSSVRGLDAAAV